MNIKFDKILGTPRESDIVVIQPQHIFVDAAARDAYFDPNKLFELTTGLEIVTAGEIEKWIGESYPITYVNTNWKSISGTALSAAEIKTLYESNPDTNALIDAKLSILNHLSEDSNGILSDVSWTFPPGSIHIGDSVIESGGRIISAKSTSTGNQGSFQIQLFDETQYSKAIVYDHTQTADLFDIQVTDDTVASGTNEMNILQFTQNDIHLNKIRFKPENGVITSDFNFEIRLSESGNPIYRETITPSEPIDLGGGIFELTLCNPSAFDTGFNTYIKIDGISLLGGYGFDGTDGIRTGEPTNSYFFPWLRTKGIPIIRNNVATENYVDDKLANMKVGAGYFHDVVNTYCEIADVWYKVDATFTSQAEVGFQFDNVNNRWVFTNYTNGYSSIMSTWTGAHDDGNSRFITWEFRLNGNQLPNPPKEARIEPSDPMSMSLLVPYITLNTGDYIELYCKCDSSSDWVRTSKFNFLIR